jgi:hypothetical protein
MDELYAVRILQIRKPGTPWQPCENARQTPGSTRKCTQCSQLCVLVQWKMGDDPTPRRAQMNYFGIQTELSVDKRSFCLTQFHPYSKITQQLLLLTWLVLSGKRLKANHVRSGVIIDNRSQLMAEHCEPASLFTRYRCFCNRERGRPDDCVSHRKGSRTVLQHVAAMLTASALPRIGRGSLEQVYQRVNGYVVLMSVGRWC